MAEVPDYFQKIYDLTTFLITTIEIEGSSFESRRDLQRNIFEDADNLWLITWQYSITDEQINARLTTEEMEKFVNPIIHTLKYFEVSTYEEILEIRLGFQHKMIP